MLHKLEINGNIIERERVTKFLGVLLDENLSWKPHINTIKNKISKNIGLLYKARYIIKEKCLTQLYFSNMNSYLTYANIVWGSTYKSNLMPLYRKRSKSDLFQRQIIPCKTATNKNECIECVPIKRISYTYIHV